MDRSAVTGLVCLLAAAASGCSSKPSGPTFYEDVAPIVYQNCVTCHSSEGIAPTSLITYAQARPVGELMAQYTAERTMPPYPADNSGACNTYQHARWLTDAQIATIGDWFDAGMPEGDPAHAPELPTPAAGLPTISATLDPAAEYTPNQAISDDYRCFVLDAPATSDEFLTAFEVHPGRPGIVHHVILYAPASASDASAAEQLDAAETGLGYTCFGGARVSASPIAGWAPGTGATVYPSGTGVQIHGGVKLVMQVHYNTENGAEPDRTTIDVTLAPNVTFPAIFQGVGVYNLNLPPGLAAIDQTGTFQNPAAVPVRVHGAFPHMHLHGTSLNVSAEKGGEKTCLVDVPRWDFHWQQLYLYDKPITLAPGASVETRCTYDTSAETDTLHWGEGTADEMCLTFFYVSL